MSAAVAELRLLPLDWPLPHGVRAAVTTRIGGGSKGPYRGANLGDHVADDPAQVAANRLQLAQQCGVRHWQWLQQVHGVEVIEAGPVPLTSVIGDAVTTPHKGVACAVLTADCLPVLICARDGSQVAAVHAGWRGLADGILGHSIARFHCRPEALSVYLGPAIGPDHFEVGQEVYDTFKLWNIEATLWQQLFKPQPNKAGHYLADLYGLARWALTQSGVEQIFGGDLCTYCDLKRFYSYRRDGVTGRMASAIWLDKTE